MDSDPDDPRPFLILIGIVLLLLGGVSLHLRLESTHAVSAQVLEEQRIRDLEVQEKMWESRIGSRDYPMTVIAPALQDIRDELKVRRGR